MTANELRDILVGDEFRHDLQEMSSYLASIKQERPIIYALAKRLWKQRRKFCLEDDRRDLVVHKSQLDAEQKVVEFKLHYDCDLEKLADELKKHGDKLDDARAIRNLSKWGLMRELCNDLCIKRPDIFVWIICSRDLTTISDCKEDLDRVCWSAAQGKYNSIYPYNSGNITTRITAVANEFLGKLRLRPFTESEVRIETNGDFRSTYYFRIYEFSTV